MVTVSDLEDWEFENEEDVFFDGPYNFSNDQWDELGIEVYKRLNEEFDTTHIWMPFWEDGLLEGYWDLSSDRSREICLEAMAYIINEYNIQKFFVLFILWVYLIEPAKNI